MSTTEFVLFFWIGILTVAFVVLTVTLLDLLNKFDLFTKAINEETCAITENYVSRDVFLRDRMEDLNRVLQEQREVLRDLREHRLITNQRIDSIHLDINELYTTLDLVKPRRSADQPDEYINNHRRITIDPH